MHACGGARPSSDTLEQETQLSRTKRDMQSLNIHICSDAGCRVGAGVARAVLIVQPRNTVVVVGESTQLRCQTNVSATSSSSTAAAAVSWKFTSVDGQQQNFIYNENGLSPSYEARGISVLVNDSTVSRLHFESVELRDAGTYTCQDDGGIGDPHAAWLAVLGTTHTHTHTH